MPPRKRTAPAADSEEPIQKRRSLRSAAAQSKSESAPRVELTSKHKRGAQKHGSANSGAESKPKSKPVKEPASKVTKAASKKASSKEKIKPNKETPVRERSEDLDVAAIPTHNPDAPQHEGEWYWLMKAEPETRLENGIDVRFSIDDLRAKTEPEGWDGIRAYPARNNMRNMNAGDKAFFYHSNCKEPGIVGIMEIVKEYSEDSELPTIMDPEGSSVMHDPLTVEGTARQPGTPYYDPSSTKEKPKWDLVHVEFRKKFAVKIGLKELRELGKPGGPLENMQMLKQSRLSVSRVGEVEWKALCELADEKAKEAGLEHET